MIKVTALYKKTETSTFDMEYFCKTHMPMVKERAGAALKTYYVDEGISGSEPGSSPIYAAMGHLIFETIEDFQTAISPHLEEIMGDVPNYSNLEPIIFINEIKV